MDNNYLLFLGIAYLFIGGFDLIHTLAYTGMNIFQGYGTNLPTQLWISARYIEGISLIIAPFFLRHKLKFNFTILIYCLISFFLMSTIFYWRIFPVCFIEGEGLTAFKIISEYIISLILLGSIVLLFQRQDSFETDVFRWLVASIVTTIFSELALSDIAFS